ncbi:MAG: T9SS type A sorting domain-containing protein, partial [Bacteroidetes bacterium]|nr:T9SS type A sorting domain-containing protein [Bacteroidota bacterium]
TAGNLSDQTFGDGCATEPDYNAMSVSGGTGPYMFYSFVVGTAVCNGNALATSYLVEVDDAEGCIGNFYVDVNYVQDDYSITIDNTTPENCGAGDGTFSYTVANLSNQSCINPTWSLDITGVNTSSQTGISSSSAYQSSTEYNYSADTYNYVLSGLGSCIAPVTGSFSIYSSIAGVTSYTYDTICNNSAVTWNGTTYTQTGVYSYLMAGGSAGGCDSTAYLDLNVAPTYSTAWYDTISVGQSVTLGGQQYNAAGVYTATLTSVSGCDSTVTLYLTVLQSVAPVTTYLTEQICAGSNYIVGIHSYTAAGSYTDTLSSLVGGDSIVYLTLTVTQPVTSSTAASICSGSSYTWGGNSYTTAGTYTHTFTAVGGCDSIVTLTLSVAQPVTSAATASICSGSSYTWGGNSYTTAGTYTHTFTAANGCDSIVTLTLSATQPVISAATASICSGSSYTWGGNSYTAAGTYTHTFTAVGGCDSIVTLTLSVTQPVTSAATASICSGSSYRWGGNSYTAAGTYTHTFTAVGGCDSIVTLTLSVSQLITTTLADTICQGEAYAVGHNTYTATGTYTDIFTGASGCDSVQTLQLVVLQSVTPSLVISVSHGPVINGQQIDTFRADYTACDGAFYSWYLNLVPQGLHDSIAVISHFVNQADSIVCRIDCQNHCASTTYTYSNRIMSGINDPTSFLQSVSVYPNPNTGAFTLEVNSAITTTAQLSLLDVIGQNILADQMPLRTGDNKRQIQLPESAASGVYILQLLVEGHTLYQRVTVERQNGR